MYGINPDNQQRMLPLIKYNKIPGQSFVVLSKLRDATTSPSQVSSEFRGSSLTSLELRTPQKTPIKT